MGNSIKLGKRQRNVLKKLANGWYIALFTNFSEGYEETELTDGTNSEHIVRDVVSSLCYRGFLGSRKEYSTVCPDTQADHFYLKPEYRNQFK